MWRGFGLLAIAGAAALGCMTQSKLLASKQTMALQTAQTRGQFEMNCPNATATVLSSEVTQPAIQGFYVQGIERAEYTIGVEGCGDRKTFVVICPEGGDSCFAAGPGGFVR